MCSSVTHFECIFPRSNKPKSKSSKQDSVFPFKPRGTPVSPDNQTEITFDNVIQQRYDLA